jgi:hypothetical protein
MRSGTSTVSRWLRQHPQIGFASTKEVHFFDRNFARGEAWYRSQFPEGDYVARGEATPNYVYYPEALLRMARMVPDARPLVFLRNPIDRAYSHYWHNRARDKEHLSFEAALAAEPQRLEGDEVERATYSYLDRGCYSDQLRKLGEYYSRDSVGVWFFDDLQKDEIGTLRSVSEFIGVDPALGPEASPGPVNAYVEFRSVWLRNLARRMPGLPGRAVAKLNTRGSGSYEPMNAATREDLVRHFAPLNEDLASFLGRDLPDWDR